MNPIENGFQENTFKEEELQNNKTLLQASFWQKIFFEFALKKD